MIPSNCPPAPKKRNAGSAASFPNSAGNPTRTPHHRSKVDMEAGMVDNNNNKAIPLSKATRSRVDTGDILLSKGMVDTRLKVGMADTLPRVGMVVVDMVPHRDSMEGGMGSNRLRNMDLVLVVERRWGWEVGCWEG